MADSEQPTTKRCSKCGEIKDLESGFCRNATTKDGRQYHCKMCNKEYSEATTERRRKSQRAYYLANRESFLAKRAAYRAQNLDKIEAYRAANKEEIKAQAAAYRATRKDKLRLYNVLPTSVARRAGRITLKRMPS